MDDLRVSKGAHWLAHVEYLTLALGGLTLLWATVEAFWKRQDPPFRRRVRGKSREQAFGWLVIAGLSAVGLFWRQPFWTRPLTYGLFVQFGLTVLFARYAILCYRAPRSGVKGTSFSLQVLFFLIGMPVLAAMGAYLFPPLELLQSQWTEMRVFGFAGPFFRTLAGAIAGILLWGAALFLGVKLLRKAVENSSRQP